MTGSTQTPKRVVLSGPLSEYGPGFAAALEQRGFMPLSVEHQLRLLAHLSRWMHNHGLVVGQLTGVRVDDFLIERRASYTALYSPRALRPLLAYLTGLGVLPAADPAPPTTVDMAVEGFKRYLLTERGLQPKTAAAQVSRVRRFLADYCPPGGIEHLSTAEVTRALLGEGVDHAPATVKRLGYTLKAFLRYALLAGLIEHDLTGAVVPVKSHQPSMLPIGISHEQTTMLLAACDRDTVVGRRDYAVIVLLARLGLRAIEVARLQLSDIDWHHGEITVRGKGHRDERMPLPAHRRPRPAGCIPCRPSSASADGPGDGLIDDRPSLPTGRDRPRRRASAATLSGRGHDPRRDSAGGDRAGTAPPRPAHHGHLRVDIDTLRRLAAPWPGGAR